MQKHGLALVAALLTVVAAVTAAQPQPRAAGHWEGTIDAGAQPLNLEIDLQRSGDKWEGTMSVPAQSLKGFPLSVLTVEGDTVSFAIKLPGEPQFKGVLSADGKSLTGDFTQHGMTTKLALTRTGDAKIEPLPKSTPITKDLEGSWAGTLDVKGTPLRLELKLSNQPNGVGGGTLVSVDQGGAEIPVSAVVQTGAQVKVLVPTVAGAYEGEIKDGVLTGTWSQGPLTLPLIFKRSK